MGRFNFFSSQFFETFTTGFIVTLEVSLQELVVSDGGRYVNKVDIDTSFLLAKKN